MGRRVLWKLKSGEMGKIVSQVKSGKCGKEGIVKLKTGGMGKIVSQVKSDKIREGGSCVS